MIVPPRTTWGRRLFAVHGTALTRIWGRLAFFTGFATLVTVIHQLEDGADHMFDFTVVPFTLVGFALGIFLGFRNNTSYDRYWEGRKLWGALVNTTRSFTRLSLTLIDINATPQAEKDPDAIFALQRDIVHRTIGYVFALKLHLRREIADLHKLEPFFDKAEIDALASEKNLPVAVLQTIGDRLREAFNRGWVHPFHLPSLEDQLTALTDIQGGCERIKSTPIPYSYSVLMHRIVAVYCFTLPIGLVTTTALVTPVVVLLIAYAFLGLDAVGDEIEDPFGHDVNDLPLSQLSRMIEVNLRQRLGETDLPPLLLPDPRGTLF